MAERQMVDSRRTLLDVGDLFSWVRGATRTSNSTISEFYNVGTVLAFNNHNCYLLYCLFYFCSVLSCTWTASGTVCPTPYNCCNSLRWKFHRSCPTDNQMCLETWIATWSVDYTSLRRWVETLISSRLLYRTGKTKIDSDKERGELPNALL